MDERRREGKPHEISRDEFLQDSSEAVRRAKEHGSVLITESDGRPFAVLSIPRSPLDFD